LLAPCSFACDDVGEATPNDEHCGDSATDVRVVGGEQEGEWRLLSSSSSSSRFVRV
jgi:hypothetical protein